MRNFKFCDLLNFKWNSSDHEKCIYFSKGKNASGMHALAKSISLDIAKFICMKNNKHTIQIVSQMIVFV